MRVGGKERHNKLLVNRVKIIHLTASNISHVTHSLTRPVIQVTSQHLTYYSSNIK